MRDFTFDTLFCHWDAMRSMLTSDDVVWHLFNTFQITGSSLPDFAHVMAYIPDGTTEPECGDTAAPTVSSVPSSVPSINFVPSIPDGVSLRITSCFRETSNLFRFNCAIEPTQTNRHPGSSDSDPVVFCVTWRQCMFD